MAARRLPALVIVAIGVAYAVMEWSMTPIGDDAGYRDAWLRFNGLEGYVRWSVGHWIGANGRLPNFILPPLLAILPQWLIAILDGLAVSASFWLTLSLSRLGSNRTAASLFLISVIAFTFPWWDSTLLNCVMLNYVWAVAVCLLWLRLWLSDSLSLRWRYPLYILSAIAGMMHEAISLPICAALFIYLLADGRWKSVGHIRRAMALWFLAGTIFCAFCPSIIMRLVEVRAAGTPDDPMWLLVLKSDFWALLLLFVVVVMWIANPRRLAGLVRSEWLVFALAAFASMCISAVGGIVGRSGWFACTFALIALFRMGSGVAWRIPRPLAAALSALMVILLCVHYCSLVAWQTRLNGELSRAVELYSRSADGIVYLDYTPDSSIPGWLLHKQRGVPDSDDFYLLLTISKSYGDSTGNPMVILPEAARNIDLRSVRGDVAVGDGWITDRMPRVDRRGLFERDGQRFVAHKLPVDSASVYFVTRCDFDPGDR